MCGESEDKEIVVYCFDNDGIDRTTCDTIEGILDQVRAELESRTIVDKPSTLMITTETMKRSVYDKLPETED